jgi:y4mF family transcriptional regulator
MAYIETPSDLGRAIRTQRKRIQWDQARLASSVGVSRQWVIEIEKGKPRAELHLVLRTLDALGLRLALGVEGISMVGISVPSVVDVPMIDINKVVEHHLSQRDFFVSASRPNAKPASLRSVGASVPVHNAPLERGAKKNIGKKSIQEKRKAKAQTRTPVAPIVSSGAKRKSTTKSRSSGSKTP